MNTYNEGKHPRGQAGNAGQFRNKSWSEPESALTVAVGPATISIAVVAELETGYTDDLPDYPANLPAPDVSWDLSDGRVETFVQVGDRGITFWRDDSDEPGNSLEDRLGFSDENGTDRALLDWGNALNTRITDLQYGTQHAIFPQTQAAILNAALGRPTPTAREIKPNP